MTTDYRRPRDIEEALEARGGNPEATWIAGGTIVLSGDHRERPQTIIDLDGLLPEKVERFSKGGGTAELVMGAGVCFQRIVDAGATPPLLRAAALGMANRNVRNRATLGGNIAAGKTCASLIPALLVLESRLTVALPGKGRAEEPSEIPLADWLASPRGIILEVRALVDRKRRGAALRWGRSACDLSVITAAASFLPGPAGELSGLRIALGGAGPRARRFPEIEALFEGKLLPPKAEIEAVVAPLLSMLGDHRGSAAFKRLRGAALVADTLHEAINAPGEVGA